MRRKGQESRARQILASMRAAYMTQLERSGRFSPTQIKTMTEKAFGKTVPDTQEIVERAVDHRQAQTLQEDCHAMRENHTELRVIRGVRMRSDPG
jgi:hypothetical protein